MAGLVGTTVGTKVSGTGAREGKGLSFMVGRGFMVGRAVGGGEFSNA